MNNVYVNSFLAWIKSEQNLIFLKKVSYVVIMAVNLFFVLHCFVAYSLLSQSTHFPRQNKFGSKKILIACPP